MNAITSQDQKKSVITDPYEKGYQFEEYITKLFNARRFKLEKWHKSQRIESGLYLTGMSHPDLELIFVGRQKYRFAVECKWRKELLNGKVSWVNSYNQITHYKNFQSCNRIPVFIAIGIGGEPSAPERLFLTPLDKISGFTEVYESELIPYTRNPSHKFFYDTVQLKLF
ncbi:hypothetical protein [Agriterribacter sp.]|uniref:hypothetical protein n=1 Tax=Agriterribacter sp. TaxID=2821509 RepID=UPI002C756AC3|nr:hypothetical protein [Agriterribacter sp.]HRO45337.1 hypothetical protein [Agriterribacter sp.]HRQ17102.1 hypothetical protein [Agriterribacter sp.]